MASPFRLFRKNMKPLMAIMFVLLMLSWVVGDAVFNYFGGSRNAGPRNRQNAGAVAVSWNGGKLTNLQVQDLVTRRHILNGFLEQVMMMGERSAYEAGVEPRPLHVQDLRGPDTPQQGIERSVVNTRIFADAARAAGMNVSDDAVVQYLDELGRGNVSRAKKCATSSRACKEAADGSRSMRLWPRCGKSCLRGISSAAINTPLKP